MSVGMVATDVVAVSACHGGVPTPAIGFLAGRPGSRLLGFVFVFRRLARAYRKQKVLLAVIAALNVVSAGTEALALIAIAPLVDSATREMTATRAASVPGASTCRLSAWRGSPR